MGLRKRRREWIHTYKVSSWWNFKNKICKKKMMVSDGVNDCKEKFKHLKLEISKRGNNKGTENAFNYVDLNKYKIY